MESKIYLAGGCFWCTEAIFSRFKGVISTRPGYLGGKTENPSYKEVCTGTTDHAEAIELVYDTNVLSNEEVLHIFFATHDPTSLNRQGGDVGTQYRSAVFYTQENQFIATQKVIKTLENEKIYDKAIVTEVLEAPIFYPAEVEHENFFELNPTQSYCAAVIAPKVAMTEKIFKEKLK